MPFFFSRRIRLKNLDRAVALIFFLFFFGNSRLDLTFIPFSKKIGKLKNKINSLKWTLLIPQVEVLYFSFGIILGVGASLAYTSSLVILGHYFTKYLGVANGVATAGSPVFTLAFPYFLQALIDHFKLKGCFLGVAMLMSLLLGESLVWSLTSA